ncbi:MAG: efflux RND transporter periplasmic adaptor subunit [Desulfobacterales bacterium]
MGMDLIPVYEDELVGGVNISIDPVVELNMGIRTSEVKRGPLTHTIRTYGHITYDETRMTRVNLKFSGWLEKPHVDFTGEMVEQGQPLFDIYSPELITAQQDLIEAYRNYQDRPSETNKKVLDSVRRRLGYYDIAETEISEIEKSGAIRQALTIRSPFSGVVTQKNAFEGAYVESGTTVYEIADLSRLWVEAHIYEYELAAVQKGQSVEMTLPYLPGKQYSGTVSYVYPYLQRKTRDVVVRLEFDNPELELKPDMYADVKIQTRSSETGTIIPARSVLRTGERNLVFIRRAPGEFTPREVTLGMPLDKGMVEVLNGVAPGETVVTSGQFLLDSESKLNESVQKMTPPESEKGHRIKG